VYLLIGYEFPFFGDRLRILESARETEAGSLLGEYFARRERARAHPSQHPRIIENRIGEPKNWMYWHG
jgi:hypothetical protein